jgi:hypothetical protein
MQQITNIEGTAYEIIANALGLVQDGKAWVDKDGERFVLTKYGFQYAALVPAENRIEQIRKKYAKIIQQNEKTIERRNKEIERLKDMIEFHRSARKEFVKHFG